MLKYSKINKIKRKVQRNANVQEPIDDGVVEALRGRRVRIEGEQGEQNGSEQEGREKRQQRVWRGAHSMQPFEEDGSPSKQELQCRRECQQLVAETHETHLRRSARS